MAKTQITDRPGSTRITLPEKLPPYRPSAERLVRWDEELREFARQLRELQSSLDFHMGARDWCYHLERHGLKKGDFDHGQTCIDEARRAGYLRPGFILEEEGHKVNCPYFDEETEEEFLDGRLTRYHDAKQDYLDSWNYYDGIDFWADKKCFIQVFVEKAGLKSLFADLCDSYYIPMANTRGWGSLEQRAAVAMTFSEHEDQGRSPVLLAVGDFDPAGLWITKVLGERFKEIKKFSGWDPRLDEEGNKLDENALTIERVGLNHDFIMANELTWIDGLMTGSGLDMADPKHKFWQNNTYNVQEYVDEYGKAKVEANAIVVDPELGRKMLEDAIERHVGKGALAKHRARLKRTRTRLKTRLAEQLG